MASDPQLNKKKFYFQKKFPIFFLLILIYLIIRFMDIITNIKKCFQFLVTKKFRMFNLKILKWWLGRLGWDQSEATMKIYIYIILIDYVYIDGPCASKTLAGVLLVHFEKWVTWLTLIDRTNRSSVCTVWLGTGISLLKCLLYTIGPGSFLITKKSLANNLSIDPLLNSSHGPTMYTLSLLHP